MKTVTMLKLPYQFGSAADAVYPVILRHLDSAVLIDCGFTGMLPALEQAALEAGSPLDTLTDVFVTHQDHDHMGTLAALKRKYPAIKVWAGEVEAPYVSGESESLRLLQAEALQKALPEDQKAFGEAFIRILQGVETVRPDGLLKDGDHLPWGGGCRVIATPGHTPGHLSLYVEPEDLLIAGDAAVAENGVLVIANPQFTLDTAAAERSLEKLKAWGAGRMICYHSGLWHF